MNTTNLEYEIICEEEFNADCQNGEAVYLTRLNGIYDHGNEYKPGLGNLLYGMYGLGDWAYYFKVEVTKADKAKIFDITFQPEERTNGMKAYTGYDLYNADDADQSQELIDFCDGDESIINELYKIAHKAAKSEYNRLIELLKNEEITASENY